LLVGAEGDVGGVGDLFRRVVHLRQVDANRQPEEAVNAPHPVRIALGEVIVDGHDVHAAAGQRIQVRRQCRDQRLALAGSHFGDLPVVKTHAPDELHVEVPHLEAALAGFAHHRECLRHHVVERFAFGHALLERRRLGAQLLIGQRGKRGLERIDLLDHLRVLLQQPLIPAAEDLGEDIGDHKVGISSRRAKKQGVRTTSPLSVRRLLGVKSAWSRYCAEHTRPLAR